MLLENNKVFPIGLLLMADGTLDVSVAAYDSAEQVPNLLNAMQTSFSEKVLEKEATASCIAYPDYGSGEIVAFLENRENYCAKARIPVAEEPRLHVDVRNIVIEDGSVYVFPANV